MTMRYRNSGLVISLVVAACTAGCSSLPAPGAGDRPQIQSSADPSAQAACFYSDRSGTDRLAGGRVVHWCGPEPKPCSERSGAFSAGAGRVLPRQRE
jgi:hypothetical protein